MTVSTTPNVTLGPGVQEFLRKNDAEASFQTICEIIRECFLAARSVEAELQEDHDEPGWWRVLMTIVLPASLPVDVWLEQNKRYHERQADRIPSPQNMLFVTRHHSPAE